MASESLRALNEVCEPSKIVVHPLKETKIKKNENIISLAKKNPTKRTHLDSGFLLISRMYLILAEPTLVESLFGRERDASLFSIEASVDKGVDEDQRSLIPLAVVPMQHNIGGAGNGGSVEKWRVPENGLGPTAFSACTLTLGKAKWLDQSVQLIQQS